MTIATLQSWLLWCTILNFGLLAFWGVFLLIPHAWLSRFYGRWFRITPEQFDVLMLNGALFYKVLILLFNFMPYVALRIAAG